MLKTKLAWALSIALVAVALAAAPAGAKSSGSSHSTSSHSSSSRNASAGHATATRKPLPAGTHFVRKTCKTAACKSKHPGGSYMLPIKPKKGRPA
jgi:hypothetical protein